MCKIIMILCFVETQTEINDNDNNVFEIEVEVFELFSKSLIFLSFTYFQAMQNESKS